MNDPDAREIQKAAVKDERSILLQNLTKMTDKAMIALALRDEVRALREELGAGRNR
jgi:hypothetical protein